jgi:hypothetical protein
VEHYRCASCGERTMFEDKDESILWD